MKKKFLLNFIRHRDQFGHRVSVTYKGHDKLNSVFGGCLSLLIQTLTLLMAIILIEKAVSMHEPDIINYKKTLSQEERDELSQLSFDNYEYIIALEIRMINSTRNNVPASFGEIYAEIEISEGENQPLELKPCAKVLSQTVMDNSKENFRPNKSLCLDPTYAYTKYFQGF